MRVLILFSSLVIAKPTAAATGKLNCMFPNKLDQMTVEGCVIKTGGGELQMEKSVLKSIKFDAAGLAGGNIENEGCYWLNKKGLLRKTHCFDNGADYFKEGLARYIDSKGQFGYMDQKLKIQIPPRFTFAFPFENGFAKACQNCKDEQIRDSEHSMVKGGQWLVIDKKGRVVKNCPEAKMYDDCQVPAK